MNQDTSRQPTDSEPQKRTTYRIRSAIVGIPLILLVGIQSYWAIAQIRGEAYAFWGDTRREFESPEMLQEVYGRAVERNPWRADWWLRYGVASRLAGAWDEADRALEHSQTLAPYNVDTLAERVQAFMQLERVDEADATLEEAFGICPNYWRLHFARGFSLGRAGDHTAALRAYEQAYQTAFFPKHLLEVQIARAYFQNDRPRDAWMHLTRALRLDDADAETWRLVGDTWLARNEHEKALSAFKHSLNLVGSLSPGDTPPSLGAPLYVGLGRAQVAVGQPVEAIKSYLRASQRDPGYTAKEMRLPGVEETVAKARPWDQFNFGQVLLLAGDTESAVRVLRGALSELPEYSKLECAIVLSHALRILRRGEEALEAIQSVTPPVGVDVEYTFALAESYAAAGKPATGRMQLQFLLSDPKVSPEARERVRQRLDEMAASNQ